MNEDNLTNEIAYWKCLRRPMLYDPHRQDNKATGRMNSVVVRDVWYRYLMNRYFVRVRVALLQASRAPNNCFESLHFSSRQFSLLSSSFTASHKLLQISTTHETRKSYIFNSSSAHLFLTIHSNYYFLYIKCYKFIPFGDCAHIVNL